MKLVETVETPQLRVGDLVRWGDVTRRVIELADSGRPALFGRGTEWRLVLEAAEPPGLPLTEMSAAASQRWARVS